MRTIYYCAVCKDTRLVGDGRNWKCRECGRVYSVHGSLYSGDGFCAPVEFIDRPERVELKDGK